MAIILAKDRTDYPNGYAAPPVITPAGTALFEGRVLGTFVDRSVRVMSDVWEDVHYGEYWDGAKIARYGIGTTGFSMAFDQVVPDADAAAYSAAFAELVAAREAQQLATFNNIADRAVAAAHALALGRTVRVVRGRKVPKGTEGEVMWLGATAYGDRLGIRDAAGTVHWTAASNVEVIDAIDYLDVEPYILTPARAARMRTEALKLALTDAADRGWLSVDAARAAIAATDDTCAAVIVARQLTK